MKVPPLRALAAVLLFLPALSGCGPDENESPTAKKLRALGNFYLEYAVANSGNGPASEAVFKKHVRGTSDQVLGIHGLDRGSLDALFVSDRDGEPFTVVYGVKISGVSGNSAPVVAHEKAGKSSKKLVGFANGKSDLVSDDKLNELLAAKP